MNYKIKKCIVDKCECFGLIDENLNKVTDFKYASIDEAGPYYFMKRVDGYYDVFAHGQVVETEYTSLEYIPFGSKWLCVGRSDTKIDLVEFEKNFYGTIGNCTLYNKTILGSTKIDDIVVGSEFVTLYTQVEGGTLKGYLYHPVFGNFMPKYTEMEEYCHVVGKPFYPKAYYRSTEKSDWSNECVYAIVTSLVNGVPKKGIITRVRKYYCPSYFYYAWEVVEPCIHDDIEKENAWNFRLIDYIEGQRKERIFEAGPYYYLWTSGLLLYGFPYLKKKFSLPPAEHYEKILSCKAEDWWKSDIDFYCETNKGKHGLYKTITSPLVRGDFDHLREFRIKEAKVEKLINCAYDTIDIVVASPEFNAFIAKKGKSTTLVFDKHDKNGNVIKKKVLAAEVLIYSSDENILLEVTLLDGTKQIVECKDKTGLIESKSYRAIKKWEDSTTGITFLFGIEEDGKFDVYTSKFKSFALGVDSFDNLSGYYVSTKKIGEETEYGIYTENECIYKHTSSEKMDLEYNQKEKLLIMYFDKHVVAQNLMGKIVLDGDYLGIKFGKKNVICKNENGYAVFKYDQDGNISPLTEVQFSSAELVADDSRIIASYKNVGGSMVYGVLESTVGNICVDFEYDKIVWEDGYFRCEKNGTSILLDCDGFLPEEPDIKQGKTINLQPKDSKKPENI